MPLKAAWLVFWDALWQAAGLPCTKAMFIRQEAAIAEAWSLAMAGYDLGKRHGRA